MLFWRPGGAPIDNGAMARAHDSVRPSEAQTVRFLAVSHDKESKSLTGKGLVRQIMYIRNYFALSMLLPPRIPLFNRAISRKIEPVSARGERPAEEGQGHSLGMGLA